MNKEIKILWNNLSVKGKIEAVRCKVSEIRIISKGRTENDSFEVFDVNAGIIISLDDINSGVGANDATVTIRSEVDPFTFKINDVNSLYPIYIAEYNVIVTTGDDKRTYSEIEVSIIDKKKLTAIQKIDNSPEENFLNAFKDTRNASCPTWLGISRDIRLFEVSFRGMPTSGKAFMDMSDYIRPRNGIWPIRKYKENLPDEYIFMVGRGIGCASNMERSLEDGYLPILNARFEDGGINYSTKMFTTFECSTLTEENVKGTHYLVSDEYFYGIQRTPEQVNEKNLILESEMEHSEEVVLYFKVIAENNNDFPSYAWMTMPTPTMTNAASYDNQTGFGKIEDDLVYLIATMNNKPVQQAETAILLLPGGKAEYLFIIPHSAITKERAMALMSNDYKARLDECKHYWNKKLSKAIQISLPEKRIENMMKAGFCHLDLISMGKEPSGPIAANIGVYCPIGSESSPIVQYFDSVGRTDLAQRALDYFFAKQHDDGFIQNFMGYMLETGAVLWTTYLHMLYTNDISWIKGKEEKIVKSCDYLIKWAKKNLKEENKGRGYGMLDGKVADPEDPYHSYMLNAYAYAGLYGSSKMLEKINSSHYARIDEASEELKKNILLAVDKSIADSPVVPLGNGHWCPSVPPWPEYRGLLCLYTDGGDFSSHSSVTTRDSMLGAIYLIFLNVIDKNSLYADFIVNSFSEILYMRHAAFSQPFYSQHGFVNLRRGERKAFIKEFYNSFAGLADDETYTFWEHFHLVSPHKTHEEAWFLMKCRNMLYSEDMDNGNNQLIVMPGVPSEWFLSKEDISVIGANTYFGELSYELKHIEPLHRISIDVKLNLRSEQYPKVKVRVPLPENMSIASINAGFVCEGTNDILVDDFKGDIELYIILKKK